MVARFAYFFTFALLGFAPPLFAQQVGRDVQQHILPLPDRGQYVVDSADLLDEAAERTLQQIAEELQREKSTPLFVVTIDSVASNGGNGMRIEEFSKAVLGHWQFKSRQSKLRQIRGVNWHSAILLLVAKDDRKARIQFASPRGRKDDAIAQEIMDTHIVRQFKRGQFSEGIVAGATGLDSLVRKRPLPSSPWPMWAIVLIGGVGTVFVLFSISFYRSGLESWAWRCMKAVIDGMSEGPNWDYDSSGDNGYYSDSGGFSGGGFSGGGDCSSDGGATGSW